MLTLKAYFALGAAALVVALLGIAYVKVDAAGYARAEAKWQAAVIKAQNERDQAVAKSLQDAQQTAIAHDNEIRDLQSKVDDYEAALQSDACLVPDDDARRLQDIR